MKTVDVEYRTNTMFRMTHEHLQNPALFPLALDTKADVVLFIDLPPAILAAASFLDRRILTPETKGTWCSWPDVRRAVAGLPSRCHFIFHISHVGSTLLSRLLGQHPAFLSLREPLILRTLAEAHVKIGQPDEIWNRTEWTERLDCVLRLWSRTHEPQQTTVIKATSFVSDVADQLLEQVADSRALLMYVSPQTFLCALLDGAMSDIATSLDARQNRLRRYYGDTLGPLKDPSPGEAVAMSWLCEMTAHHRTATRFPDRVSWLDFDRFLESPEFHLHTVCRHFGISASDTLVNDILAGQIMSRYAKAPTQAYDTLFRTRLLDQASQKHSDEIQRGLRWLDRIVAVVPSVQSILHVR